MPEQYAPRRVFAIVPNWLGDAVMCTAALRTLKQRFPEAELIVFGRIAICAALAGLPYVSQFVELPAKPGFLKMLGLARRFRRRGEDVAAVFPHSFRAALLAKMLGANRVVAYRRNKRAWLVTDPVEPKRDERGRITPVYMTWEYLDLLEPLTVEYDGFGLDLAVDDTWVARIKEHLIGPGPYIGIAPGAAFGPSKRWLPERFAEVADALHEKAGAQCVLLTGPGEEDTRDAVLAAATHELTVCDEGNPTIDSLKATVSLLDLLVTNDSGPRHVAVGLHVPAICVMGPTSPSYTEGPYEKGEVVRIDVECGPCQKPVCPTGTHECMKGVTAERVLRAALNQIARAQVRG